MIYLYICSINRNFVGENNNAYELIYKHSKNKFKNKKTNGKDCDFGRDNAPPFSQR